MAPACVSVLRSGMTSIISRSLFNKRRSACLALQRSSAALFGFGSSKSPKLVCEKLQRRGLLQIKGADSSKFLQGLITNDMRHFDGHGTGTRAPSMYAMILNVNGQVLYDIIIYNLEENGTGESSNFLVECDVTGVQGLTTLFTVHRLRKKVDLVDVSQQFVPWVAFRPASDAEAGEPKEVGTDQLKPEVVDPSKVKLMAKDPRMQTLGWRIILPTGVSPKDVLKVDQVDDAKSLGYHKLRFKLGVGEGIADLPPGRCYPLESNADYLHGVSFHKGCYVGQELTARTHHTGVIRKRLMPLVFKSDTATPIDHDTVLENEKGRNVGRFANRDGKFGLGLLRTEESLSAAQIRVKSKGIEVTTYRPSWWPVEQPKESFAARG